MAAPGQNLWTTNATPPQDRWLPIATKEGIYAGELNFHIHWTKTEVKYRPIVTKLTSVVGKTQTYTKSMENYIETSLNSLFSLVSGVYNSFTNLTPLHTVLAIVASIIAAIVGGIAIVVPAVIFFPITLLLLTVRLD